MTKQIGAPLLLRSLLGWRRTLGFRAGRVGPGLAARPGEAGHEGDREHHGQRRNRAVDLGEQHRPVPWPVM
ncbi:hypothetical protein [Streptomyces sp. JJ38]|uniref:hypothetical protein n=1 Tax=Streptomyces sp. JJ38 TaxID=2738128 RepID=UPI001C56D9B4|nr:hypothetical protein [Streptomyces sp. JJ38]MBW1597412.1 hypothetical protein [Streptomyces sp. JJ38]